MDRCQVRLNIHGFTDTGPLQKSEKTTRIITVIKQLNSFKNQKPTETRVF
jgi:hypothetical protein